jgi:hypothetical protein
MHPSTSKPWNFGDRIESVKWRKRFGGKKKKKKPMRCQSQSEAFFDGSDKAGRHTRLGRP